MKIIFHISCFDPDYLNRISEGLLSVNAMYCLVRGTHELLMIYRSEPGKRTLHYTANFL
jgi:hypothetical protein